MMTLPDEPTVALYARMSNDSKLGIDRQLEDIRDLARRQGWTIGEEYIDDGVSATKAKPRPNYDRMLAAVREGRHRIVICWDQDRLLRKVREGEDWLDLAEDDRAQVFDATGKELTADPLAFGVKSVMSRQEVVQLKKRLRRSLVQRAEAGKPHGRPAYGWSVDLIGQDRDLGDTRPPRRMRIGRDELDPVAAGVIRETADRLLKGESIRSICADLNHRGVTTAGGGRWSGQQLRTVMLRPRNAGIRVHRGEEVGIGDWPTIYDRDTHDRLVALLTDPSRSANRGSERRHLLSMIARCGLCETPSMIVNTGGTSGRRPAYTCARCHRVTRVQDPVDAMVESSMIDFLTRPNALDKLATGDPVAVSVARAEMAAAEARMALAAEEFAHGRWTAEQVARVNRINQPRITAADAAIKASLPKNLPAHLAGSEAARNWREAKLDQKRALITALVTVTIMPSGPGRRKFDPTLIVIKPIAESS